MAEVDILKFLTDPWHMFLVAAAFASGAMLIWPLVRRAAAGASISTLQATLLINQQNALVLDVREAAEYEKGHMLNARNVPLGELEARAGEIDKHKAKPVIVVCDNGNRSGRAATVLRKLGFEQVFRLGAARPFTSIGVLMSDVQQPTFGIEKIYVKDLSLEVPGGPQTFMQSEQPQLEVQITQQSQRVNELLFEVTLVITVSAKHGDKTLFLVEASQAGVFQIRNVPDSDLAPVLGIACPNVLFPSAR